MGKALYARKCQTEKLTTHEANTLYAYRAQLRTGGWELLLLWRSLLSDDSSTMPGWYWHKEADARMMEFRICIRAMYDSHANVRVRAIQIMRDMKLIPSEDAWDDVDVISHLALDEEEEVQKALLEYLKQTGTPQQLSIVQELCEGSSTTISEAGIAASLGIKIREDSASAFKELFELDNPPPAAITLLRDAVADVPSELLNAGIASANGQIRTVAVRALASRSELTTGIARALLNDDSRAVRQACYSYLISEGERPSPDKIRESLKSDDNASAGLLGSFYVDKEAVDAVDADGVVKELYNTYTCEELLKEIGWLSLDGPIAYRVLANRYFEEEADRIRKDLSDGFEGVRLDYIRNTEEKLRQKCEKSLPDQVQGESRSQLINNFVEKSMSEHVEQMERVAESIRGSFLTAALAGIASHGERTDAEIARRFLMDRKPQYYGAVAVEAARVIKEFGDCSDVTDLLTVARELTGDQREGVLNAAIALSPGPTGAIAELVKEQETSIVGHAIDALAGDTSTEAKDLLTGLLNAPNPAIRKRALLYFVTTCEDAELEQILKDYTNGSYYYNVVCWLDRCLYAPEPLRSVYRNRLK